MNIGGLHITARSDRPVPAGDHILGFRMRHVKGKRIGTLLIDGEPCGGVESEHGFNAFISWSGLDIGLDRGSPVADYQSPSSSPARCAR